MKKMNRSSLLIMLLIVLACDDFVDIEPRGNSIATTLDDVNQLLNNATVLSAGLGNTIPGLLNDNIQIPNERLLEQNASQTTSFISNIYNLEPLFYEGNISDDLWSSYYESIGNVNHVIQVLDNLESDSPLRNQYRAEAQVHRAFAYFRLVNIYGPHYGLPEAAQSGSGVPILTVFSDDSVPISRASVNEVYDFVLQDLNEAVAFLAENVISNDRASLGSALGLLAEVEMHRGNYERALDLIEQALGFNRVLLDYNTDITGLVPPSGVANPESLFLKNATTIRSFSPMGFTAYSDELVAISDTINDLRFTLFTERDAFDNFSLNANYSFEFGVTVPRLMLLNAECHIRTGNIQLGMDLINELRSKRFDVNFVDFGGHILTASNAEEALVRLEEESRREYHINGLRFFDIKRWNAIEGAGIALNRNGKIYAPNSINWAVPIAQTVIDTSNGQIQQNQRE